MRFRCVIQRGESPVACANPSKPRRFAVCGTARYADGFHAILGRVAGLPPFSLRIGSKQPRVIPRRRSVALYGGLLYEREEHRSPIVESQPRDRDRFRFPQAEPVEASQADDQESPRYRSRSALFPAGRSLVSLPVIPIT